MFAIKELSLDRRDLKHSIVFLVNLNEARLSEPESWQEKYSCFAKILQLDNTGFTNIDNLNFGHINIENIIIFKIRYTNQITKNMRITFNKRNFEIKKITDLQEANRIIQIIANEII